MRHSHRTYLATCTIEPTRSLHDTFHLFGSHAPSPRNSGLKEYLHPCSVGILGPALWLWVQLSSATTFYPGYLMGAISCCLLVSLMTQRHVGAVSAGSCACWTGLPWHATCQRLAGGWQGTGQPDKPRSPCRPAGAHIAFSVSASLGSSSTARTATPTNRPFRLTLCPSCKNFQILHVPSVFACVIWRANCEVTVTKLLNVRKRRG